MARGSIAPCRDSSAMGAERASRSTRRPVVACASTFLRIEVDAVSSMLANRISGAPITHVPFLEARSAPLASRGERYDLLRTPWRNRPGFTHRQERRVGVGICGGKSSEGGDVLSLLLQVIDLVDGDLAGRQRAGLVHADNVDARQGFHGRQLLHQCVSPCQPHHSDRERDAREEN